MRRPRPLVFSSDDGAVATVEAVAVRGRRHPVFRARCIECGCDLVCLASPATDQAVSAVIAHVAEFHGGPVRAGGTKTGDRS
ncbi:MAG: hypothetical protein ACYCV7_14095 [Acidimicrobiales bacterium]